MDTRVGDDAAAAATHASRRVVLFDFDGVLMRGDAFTRFVRARLFGSWWRLPIALLLIPVLWPFSRIRRLRMPVAGVFVRLALLGVHPERFAQLVRDFAADLVQQPRIFIREGVSAMRRHVVAGDRVVIVTGCELTLAQAIFAAIGLHGLEIIASRLRKGHLGMRKDVHNIGSQKPRQIAAYGISEPWDMAYSDSSRDIPMLKGARVAILVNADAATCRRVERALGRPVRKVDWF